MPYIFKKYYPVRSLVFCAGEGFLIFSTFSAVQYLLFSRYLYFYEFTTHLSQAALITVVFQLCL